MEQIKTVQTTFFTKEEEQPTALESQPAAVSNYSHKESRYAKQVQLLQG